MHAALTSPDSHLCAARDIIHHVEVMPPREPRLRATLRPDFLGCSVGHMPLSAGEDCLYCIDTSEVPAIYRMDLDARLLASNYGAAAAAAVSLAKAPVRGLLYVAGACASPAISRELTARAPRAPLPAPR